MNDSPRGLGRLMTRRNTIRLLGAVPLSVAGITAFESFASATSASRSTRNAATSVSDPFASLNALLDSLAAQDQVSGTVLITGGNIPTFSRAIGMADKQKNVPNRLDTIFALASATKTFTGVAVAQLAQRGKLAFTDTIGKYLSGFPADIANNVTIHQLLTHTSGMGDVLNTPEFQAQYASWHSRSQVLDGLMSIIRGQPLLFPPGAQFSYSNSGFMTAGAIVQHVAGVSYYEYIHRHIFQAANMSSSGFYTRPQAASNPRIAHPYSAPAAGQPRQDITDTLVWCGNPAGDAYSTAPDMVRYSHALQHYRLLNPTYTNIVMTGKIHQPKALIPWHQSDSYAYGLGDSLVNNVRIVWHNGGRPGAGTWFDMYPGLGITAVLLGNYDPTVLAKIIQPEEELLTQLPS